MPMKKFSRPYYLFFGFLDASALSIAFYLSLNVLGIFFSYFTVLSNILITILFLYLGFNFKKISKTLDWIYGAAVVYMSLTGIIYWSILVNQHSLSLDPWINLTLHGAMPIAAFLSWILFPIGNKLQYKNAWQWLVPSLLFVFYTLVRGPFVNWYPYPFLNPLSSGSYIQVFINVSVIVSGTWVLGLILIWLGNNLEKRR
jgi:hypothetical protein